VERFDAFMARANAAYYARGTFCQDFVTAPELTQVFGELLGAWAQVAWQMLGAPADFILAEAGPGRGTLMANALRAFPAARGRVHFIETSAPLRAAQAARVPGAAFHDSLHTLPAGPMILLANEFLDALPVRQFVRRGTGWCERFVQDGAYVEQPATSDLPAAREGDVREINEAALDVVRQLSARGAVGLFIDYGPAASKPGESVQAISGGAYADPLSAPGTADITAHVDFAALAAAVPSQGPVKLNGFLTALGLFQRTDRLAQLHPEQGFALKAAARRLTAPEAMGSLHKVLAVCPSDLPILPGFET
jgi:NADH dehydrogenase [ubiquinone] 1 alpha subcomplex assembly factor 7